MSISEIKKFIIDFNIQGVVVDFDTLLEKLSTSEKIKQFTLNNLERKLVAISDYNAKYDKDLGLVIIAEKEKVEREKKIKDFIRKFEVKPKQKVFFNVIVEKASLNNEGKYEKDPPSHPSKKMIFNKAVHHPNNPSKDKDRSEFV